MSQYTYASILARLLHKRTPEQVQPKVRVKDVWADIFGVEANSDSYFKLLSGVQRIYSALKQQIECADIPVNAREVHRKYLNQIGAILDVANFGASWRDIASNHLTERHIEALHVIDGNLVGRVEAVGLDEAEKNDLEADIEELLDGLPSAGLPEDVAALIEKHLRSVQFVLRNFDILGVDQLQAALGLILGDAYSEFVAAKASKANAGSGPGGKTSVSERLLSIFGKGFDLINKGAQAGRSIEYFGKVVDLISANPDAGS